MLTQLKSFLFPPQKPLDLSRAQIALLSQFNTANYLKVSGWRESWEAVLQEEPQKTLERFIKYGLIIRGSAQEHASLLTIPKLKVILNKIGLPVSGKKSVLVERISSSGYDIFCEFPEGIWKCSETGLSFVTPYLAAEKQRKEDAVSGAKEALAHHDLNLAAKIAAEYHYNGIFGAISLAGECRSNGLSVSVNAAKVPAARAKEILNGLKIYQDAKKQRPMPFKHISPKVFDEAADACTWSCLDLGKGECGQEAKRVTLELWGWRANRENLARFKESESKGIILGVEILCCDDCPVGSAHKGKIYPTTQTPELPLVGCTREPCCACTYIARVKDF
jgi:hypothetical protein